jgi:putative SOS response-associated peptidase YedK
VCGRYVSPEESAIERAFHIGRSNSNPFPRKYNVFPTDTVPVLRRDRDGELGIAQVRWGLVPYWWKDEKLPARPNHIARVEEAADRPTWRDVWRRSRCLVPAEGWYEWQELEYVDARTGEIRRVKQPHFVKRADGGLACFAGLLSRWRNPSTGDVLASCAILTADATGSLAEVHERAPVVLPATEYDAWLDPRVEDPAQVKSLAEGREPPEAFVHHPVRPLVNNVKLDGPELIEPAASLLESVSESPAMPRNGELF